MNNKQVKKLRQFARREIRLDTKIIENNKPWYIPKFIYGRLIRLVLKGII